MRGDEVKWLGERDESEYRGKRVRVLVDLWWWWVCRGLSCRPDGGNDGLD